MGDNYNLALDSLYEALRTVECKDCIFDETCNMRSCSGAEGLCDIISIFKFINDKYGK